MDVWLRCSTNEVKAELENVGQREAMAMHKSPEKFSLFLSRDERTSFKMADFKYSSETFSLM